MIYKRRADAEAAARRTRIEQKEEQLLDQQLAAGPLAEARGMTERQIRAAVGDLRHDLDRKPTRAEAAERLNTTEETLKRAMRDLRMGRFPPAPLED